MNAKQTGNLINLLRTEKNLTQKQLAEMINVSDKAVSKWERGDGCPDVSIIPILANALEVDVESIMNGTLSEEMMNKTLGNTQEISATGKRIKIYDFCRPDKWSKNQMRIMWNLFEKVSTKLTSSFATMSTFSCSIKIVSVDQLTNIEFQQSIPKNCFINDYSYNQGGFVIEIDPAFGKALLKQNPETFPEIQTFDLDVMKHYITDKITEEIYSCIFERFTTIKELTPQERNVIQLPFSSYTTYLGNLLQSPNQLCMLVSLQCNAGNAHGNINLQFSDVYLSTLYNLGFFHDVYPEIKIEQLHDIKTPARDELLTVEFGRFNDVNVELEVDKILVFEKKFYSPLNLVYKNKVIHTGQAVVIDENMGLRITDEDLPDLTYTEEKYLSVQLGSTYHLPEEIEAIKKDSIIELNKMAGEFCTVIKNGQPVAYGEIIVADENFGIRICELAN